MTAPLSTIETIVSNQRKSLARLRKGEMAGSDKDLLRLTGAIASGQLATVELYRLCGGTVATYPFVEQLPDEREQLDRLSVETDAVVSALKSANPHETYRDRMVAMGKWPTWATKGGNVKPLSVDKIRVTYPDQSDARACALAFESLRILRSNLLKSWIKEAQRVSDALNPPKPDDSPAKEPVALSGNIETLPPVAGQTVQSAIGRLNKIITQMSMDESLQFFTEELQNIVAELSATPE